MGRVLLVAIAIKALVWGARAAGLSSSLLNTINVLSSAALIVGLVGAGYRLYVHTKRVVLWRVRRKLMLSYLFVGVLPVLLLILFFAIAGLLLFVNVGAYMLSTRVTRVVERAQSLAQTAAADLAHLNGAGDTAAALAAHQQRANAQFPLVSYALVPSSAACSPSVALEVRPAVATAGPWEHTTPPGSVPEWVSCAGYSSLVAGRVTRSAPVWVTARALAWVTHGGVREAVVVDVPLSDMLVAEIAADTGVGLETVRLFDDVEEGLAVSDDAPADIVLGPANITFGRGASNRSVSWTSLLDFTSWDDGKPHQLMVEFGLALGTAYEHLAASAGRINEISISQVLLIALAAVAVLFLIILVVAFLVGLSLARSITGAVHELFEGTEKVRAGDFSHKIVVRSGDQLGELAQSFNSMTASIEQLLRTKAQKERLDQELRIARGIQMSLLPQEPLMSGGLHFAGHCEPAREVGGDYYDFWAIDDHRYGMLIADVAGKGTSAALYMAELKGIVLSFSQSHSSPRQLLIDANRIISNHLDTRSFITMTYGVVDVRARTLTYARAGHCPLIRLPGPDAPSQAAEVLAPDGLVLGLKLDNGETFERLLEEATLPIAPGDLFLLYTDGLTEAMNPAGDFFGEERLSALVQSHGTAPFHQLRDEILGAIGTFVGPADQQDDMTMLLLRVHTTEPAAA
jgi:phosphoserine phosphatase RsbU/P